MEAFLLKVTNWDNADGDLPHFIQNEYVTLGVFSSLEKAKEAGDKYILENPLQVYINPYKKYSSETDVYQELIILETTIDNYDTHAAWHFKNARDNKWYMGSSINN
jgi:hypothetical protein